MKRKVLVVSYFYPPFQSIGAIRLSKFTKYLPDFGWDPIVLTAENDYAPTLPLEIAPDRVHRTGQLDINRIPKLFLGRRKVRHAGYTADGSSIKSSVMSAGRSVIRHVVNFPDGQIGWYRYALRAGRKIIARERPEVIFSSALPPTSHLVAARLAREFGLPWVAEFRDMWTDNHNFRRIQPLRSIERALESSVMSGATEIITVSEEWAAQMQQRFGRRLVHTIHNGFDRADYPSNVAPSNKFTITYTGTYYPGKQDAGPLLDALAAMRRRGEIHNSNFQLRMVGRYLGVLRTEIEMRDIGDLVTIEDSIPHDDAVRLQLESTVLLLLLFSDVQTRGWYSAKVYEYLGTGRPILVVGSKDVAAARLIEKLGAGTVVVSAKDIEHALMNWLAAFNAGVPLNTAATADALIPFERRTLTGQLAGVLDRASLTSARPE